MEYLLLPFSATALFKNKEFKKCADLRESIAYNIQLILTTSWGESAFDSTFGCSIWEHDFDISFSNNLWQDKLRRSIKASIMLHEPRLKDVEVKAQILQDEYQLMYNNKLVNKVKRKIDVKVEGRIALTDEIYKSGNHQLFIGPFSN